MKTVKKNIIGLHFNFSNIIKTFDQEKNLSKESYVLAKTSGGQDVLLWTTEALNEVI